jgi:hypothetical protein
VVQTAPRLIELTAYDTANEAAGSAAGERAGKKRRV